MLTSIPRASDLSAAIRERVSRVMAACGLPQGHRGMALSRAPRGATGRRGGALPVIGAPRDRNELEPRGRSSTLPLPGGAKPQEQPARPHAQPAPPQPHPAPQAPPAPAPAGPERPEGKGEDPGRKAQVPADGTAAKPQSPHTAHLIGAMSAEQIEQVLVQRGSRLAGKGYADFILAMERKYGVPAVQFLAQATMESQIGGDNGYAQPGFNIGNIRPGDSWTGKVVDGGSGKFRVYNSWEEGIEDYFKLLAGPIYAGKTLKDQIYTYAPPIENNTSHYYDQVVKLIKQWSGLDV